SKEEEPTPKALMATDGIGCDWSYMANEEENHALVADDEASTEFSLLAKSSSSSEIEVKNKRTKHLMNELEQVKKEKEGLDSKLTGFESATKDLDTLLGSHRTDKNKEGLGYSVVPPHAQVYSPPKKDIIMSKPMIKFIKAADSLTVIKTNKAETARKPPVRYAEMYKNTSKSPNVRGKDFLMKNKACFKCGHFDHLEYDYGVWVEKGKNWPKKIFSHKNVSPRADLLKTGRTPIPVNRTNMNGAQPKRTFFAKPTHLYVRRPFQRKSAVRTQFRVPRVSAVNKKFPTVDSKFSIGKSTFTASLGNKGKAVKASVCWIWRCNTLKLGRSRILGPGRVTS
nr:hypothetical protein [Tanacetum cinerariifolium]